MSAWIKFLTVLFVLSHVSSPRAESSCKDNLSLSIGDETFCMSDYPELLSVESGGKTLSDAAFSHSSLVFSASTAQCGGATGFAWGAGGSTPSKSLGYCERDLRTRLSNVDIKALGCACKVYFIPGPSRGNFKLLTAREEFFAALEIRGKIKMPPSPPLATAEPDRVAEQLLAAEAEKARLAELAKAEEQRATQQRVAAEAEKARLAELAKAEEQRATQQRVAAEAEKARLAELAKAEEQRATQQRVAAEAEKARLAELAKAESLKVAEQTRLLREREEELALLREQLLDARSKRVEKAPINQTGGSTTLGKIERPNGNARKALIFGNNAYKTVSPLENAVADAQAMAKKLELLGYSVTAEFDASRSKMLNTLRNFTYSVQGGDEVVFFYAGHGVELDGRNYLLPTDIYGEDPRQVQDDAIELQRVLSDMSDSRAKFTLAVIDACRDNPFKGTGRAIGGRGLAPTTAATGQMVIFSAGTGQQALDRLGERDKDPNGLFTRIFMQEMAQPNVPIDRVVKKVRQRVVQMAESVGHQQVPAIYDQVVGDFFFLQSK
jgi:hypothetical protein